MMLDGELRNLGSMRGDDRCSKDEQGFCPLADDRCEGFRKTFWLCYSKWQHGQAEAWCYLLLHCLERSSGGAVVGAEENANPLNTGLVLFEEFKVLGRDGFILVGHARDVATGSCEGCHQTRANGVRDTAQDDRYRRGFGARCNNRLCLRGLDDVNAQSDEFRR